MGWRRGKGRRTFTEERLGAVLAAFESRAGRPHGESWQRCVEQREFIEQKIKSVKLSKVRKLLLRRGVDIPYPTLRALL